MQFFCIRTEAIRRTHQALQGLDQQRRGSLRPARVMRVAQLYGHLQWRSRGSRDVRVTLRDLASAWMVQPRLLRGDLEDLQALGWLRFCSDAHGTRVELVESDAATEPVTPAPSSTPTGNDASQKPERRAAASDWISRFTALYNAHKPAAWPACNGSCAVLASRLQQAIRQAGGAEAFWAVLIRALRGMPEFWRHTYPEGRSGVECASALLKVDRGSEGRGVEHWHVFCWGDGVDVGGDVAGAAAGESDLQKAHRLLYWSRDHWHGRGIETSKLDRREKWRLAELLEAEGEGTPGTAAEQFSQPPRQH